VLLNGEDVSSVIRTIEVSSGSSKVAAIDAVQEKIVQRLHTVAQNKADEGTIVVVEGRNAATAIVPSADMKIYLTASLAVRASRRFEQWKAKGITDVTIDQVKEDVRQRDERDMNRATFPLISNPEEYGYTILDNSEMSEAETLDAIIQQLKKENLL
jgi:cytidylate kinase